MHRFRENSKKMSFSSIRRRSRGFIAKESSGLWKVENEGIDSMKERFTIKDHRSNPRTRRRRLRKNGSSEESFDEDEMEEEEGERRKRSRISKTKLKVYDEAIGVPVPRRIRSGLKRRAEDAIIVNQQSNTSIGASDEVASLSEREVEAAELLVGFTILHSQRLDGAADSFQSSPVSYVSAFPIDSKRRESMHLHSADVEKPSMTIGCKSKSCVRAGEIDASSTAFTLSAIEHQADCTFIKETPKLDEQASVQAPCSQNPSPIPVIAEEKPTPNSPLDSEPFSLPDHHEQHNSVLLNQGGGNSNASCMISNQQSDQLAEKELNQLRKDFTPVASQHEKYDPHKSTLQDSSVKDCVKKVKLEIDLMALPADSEVDVTDECKSQLQDSNQGSSNDETTSKSGTVGPLSKKDIVEQKPMQHSSVLNLESLSCKKGVAKEGVEKYPLIDIARPSEGAGPLNMFSTISNPVPLSIPSRPGEICPIGFPAAGLTGLSVAPSLPGATSVRGNSPAQQEPLVMLPPKWSSNCAAHCFIARLIHFQQHLVRLNPKPYSMNSPSQPYALLLGGPVIGYPNVLTNGSTGSCSTLSLNSPYPVVNHTDPLIDNEKRGHLPLQQSHQSGVLVFPINQMKSSIAEANAGHLSDYRGLLPTPSASFTTSGLTSTNCSTSAAVPDPRHFTILKGNYPFPNAPTYQPYTLSHSPSISPQMYARPLQHTTNPAISTGSSSQKTPEVKPFLNPPKNSPEAFNKPEHSRNGEVSHSRRKLQSYSLPTGKQCQPLNSLSPNQVKTPLKAQTSESNHVKHQFPGSIPYSDQYNPQRKMSKSEICFENNCSRKVLPMPYMTITGKTQQPFFPNSVPGHQNTPGQLFPGSLYAKKPSISQHAHLGSYAEMTKVAAVSYVQATASLPMKSTEKKPAAA